jgi:hypothetical protein
MEGTNLIGRGAGDSVKSGLSIWLRSREPTMEGFTKVEGFTTS